MEDFFSKYLSDTHWHILEQGWDPDLQNVNETRFALGNGCMGSRAILEENPPGCRPGTFFAGMFEGTQALVPELINTPNPIDLRISTRGEKLDVAAMDVLDHKRILDMRNASLSRHTLFSNARKKRYDYQSIRYFSMHDPRSAVIQTFLTPLDEDTTFTITKAINTSISNMGLVTEGEKKHVIIVESGKSGSINCVSTKTIEKGILIIYASQMVVKKGNRSYSVTDRAFKLSLKKGETACLTNYLSFNISYGASLEKARKAAVNIVIKNVKKGFDRLFKEHTKAWGRRWKRSGIEIDGSPNILRAIRFNTYHLMICTNPDCDDVSIGAKALTGEGYRGHVFWDTEIFCLPFFIYTDPDIAKNLLLYRYYRLNAARNIAKEKGFKGAMFPWESADTGKETTPSWYKDSAGNVQRVKTMDEECHITADIAYGVVHYFSATDDVDFLLKYGLEIVLEAARFWASRVEYNKRSKRYEIKHTMGPDEFHEDVNNNAFTNLIVQWNLKIAAKLYSTFHRKYPAEIKELKTKIHLKPSELAEWRKIASGMFVPFNKKTGIIEQFEGYLKRRKLPMPELDHNFFPLPPKGVKDLNKTQYVKQADVVMLIFLLSDLFSLETKRKNFQFYEDRTLHQSSLSAAIHAIVGSEVGDITKAYRYFEMSAYADLKNIYGNTKDGIHAASLGGTLQALINGFAGMRINKGVLSLNPQLPPDWKRIRFSIYFRGMDILVDICSTCVCLQMRSKRKTDKLQVMVYGTLNTLQANKKASFSTKKKKKRYCETVEFY